MNSKLKIGDPVTVHGGILFLTSESFPTAPVDSVGVKFPDGTIYTFPAERVKRVEDERRVALEACKETTVIGSANTDPKSGFRTFWKGFGEEIPPELTTPDSNFQDIEVKYRNGKTLSLPFDQIDRLKWDWVHAKVGYGSNDIIEYRPIPAQTELVPVVTVPSPNAFEHNLSELVTKIVTLIVDEMKRK
jgi:hypothetical protein